MISRILDRNSGTGDAIRLLAIQIALVATLFGAVAVLQTATASADTGTAYASTGSPTSCDPHYNPDCANSELSVSESSGTDIAGSQGAAGSESPYETQPTPNLWDCDKGFLGFCIPI